MAKSVALRFMASRATRLGLCLVVAISAAELPLGAQEQVEAPAQTQLSLDQCIELGLKHQPALAAARASLAAAYSGQQAVDNILLGRLFVPDLNIRRQQSCIGLTIASAGLTQAEWETRYAVRRTFYSVQYATMQKAVIDGAVEKIDQAYGQGKKLVDSGDPMIKVTKIDLDVLKINREFVRTKQAEAGVGILKAQAGLREAIGVGLDYPLVLASEPLPQLVKELNKSELISQARANRPELTQAHAVNQVTELEVAAQRKILFAPQAKTFAIASDIHAKPIPQGHANGDYRPGAIGPEMPPYLIGKRADRVQRAGDFNMRSMAVVDKTENLITLEVEATYLKWLEASQNVENLEPTPKMAKNVADTTRNRFNEGNVTGEEYLRARTLEEQAQGLYNQALFEHALALAALERVTAGGYRIAAPK